MVASIVLPPALPVLAGLLPRRQGHLETQPPARRRPTTSLVAAAQVGLEITFLAHQAWLMVDAIVRTLVRLSSRGGTCSSGRPPHRRRRTAISTCSASTGRWPAASCSLPSSVVAAIASQARRGLDRRPVRRAVARSAAGSRRQISLPPGDRRTAAARRPQDVDDAASDRAAGPGGSSRPSSAPRPRAAARQLPGRPATGRRPPHLADQHRHVPARHRRPPATSAGSARSRWSSGSRRRSRRSAASSASAAISTTGTTRGPCNGWSPSTSRRSTAATSPATCWRCPTPVAR